MILAAVPRSAAEYRFVRGETVGAPPADELWGICGGPGPTFGRDLPVSLPEDGEPACNDSGREVDALDDVRFTAGVLDMSDAARFLDISRSTFHRWATGYERGGPLLHVLPADRTTARVPFIAVAEAQVLEALRRAGVRPQRIRPALRRLQEEFGREYALVAKNLATDGIDVLWDFSRTSEGQGLMAGATGQLVMREIVEDYLRYIEWADDEYPRALHLRSCQPSKVVIDPYRSFGQPFFEGSRARVQDVAAMLKAGEDPEIVATEHGVSIDDVRTAARVLLGRAA
jgi:uncharacterized protein (DUF433 family)